MPINETLLKRLRDNDPKFTKLDLSNSSLKVIPSWLKNMYYIKDLDISRNVLTTLTKDIIYIKKLNLTSNKGLTEIDISNIPYLETLNIENTNI